METSLDGGLPGSGVLELAGGLGHPHLGPECDAREKRFIALYGRVEAQFAQNDVLVNNAVIARQILLVIAQRELHIERQHPAQRTR
ncbi:hypothetical protein [Mesorhizobium japonicum]|nr:hypothetical protein [Mesorhizobium japonicum]